MDVAVLLKSAELLSKVIGSPTVLKEIYSIWKNAEEIKMLADTVDHIRDVLYDLQGTQTQDASVINGYDRLGEVFLDAEDFLDRVQTIKKMEDVEAGMIEQAKEEIIRPDGKGKCSLAYACIKMKPYKNKVCRFFSRSNQAKYAVEVHNEIKDTRKKLEAISKDLKSFEVKGKEPSTSEEKPIDVRARGFNVDATEMIGRDEDKKTIVDLLLRSCADQRKIPVISVVGMGGMGKTTVAQLVYGDQNWQERCQFAMKLWVSDSKKYKFKPLLKHMLKSINPDATNLDGLEEDHLRKELIAKIGGKSFFLVLDDVDNENPWSWGQLESLLNYGNREGSRILVTTRSKKVTEVVRSSDLIHELKGLSNVDSLELFKKNAFLERTDRIPDEIVDQIVNKCCGVPLALKVIGSLLCGEDTRKWETVKNSNSLADIDERDGLMPVLNISYDDLDPTLKQCFSFCALFPKNSLIRKDILRGIWVDNIRFKTEKGESLEDVCDKNLRILYNRCFLEIFNPAGYSSTKSRDRYFKMHDLMYDLAKEVAGAEILTVDSNLEEVVVKENVRHLFFIDETPKFQGKGKRLRTIICSKGAQIQKMDSLEFVSECPVLRLLDMTFCELENLTDSVGRLIHLRYLCLSGNKFRTLPHSITELINLRHLDLSRCESLTRLPSGMDRLISLQVLDLSFCDNLEELPSGIEKMTNLKTLLPEYQDRWGPMLSGMGALLLGCHPPMFIVGNLESSHAQLEELRPLSDLPAELTIKLPKNITSKAAAGDGEALLLNKKSLLDLNIEWEHNPSLEDEVSTNHVNILAKLEPSPNLESFSLDGYQGMTFPPWVVQHGFASVLANLVDLRIINCRRCRYLPSLSRLERLDYLEPSGLSSLEYIEENISAATFCLPKLAQLLLKDLPKLKGWCRVLAAGVNDNDSEHIRLMMLPSFPCLSLVTLQGCPYLTEPSVLLSLSNRSLSTVILFDHGFLESSMEENDSRRIRFSKMITEAAESCMAEILRAVSDHLTELGIYKCKHLRTITGLQHLTGLRILRISFCPAFTGEEEEAEEKQSMGYEIESTSLHTAHHPHMPWSCLTSLQELLLSNLPSMVRLPAGLQFLISLQILRIENCRNLLIPEWLPQTFQYVNNDWVKKGMDACSTSTSI